MTAMLLGPLNCSNKTVPIIRRKQKKTIFRLQTACLTEKRAAVLQTSLNTNLQVR
jgi:hypothetical protein